MIDKEAVWGIFCAVLGVIVIICLILQGGGSSGYHADWALMRSTHDGY